MKFLKNNKNYFLILILLISITLISHPFLGIKHDGVLYFLQSLKISNPMAFDHDVFFLYGSQDQYTLFSNIYTFFIKLTNASVATAFLEFIGLIAWTGAALFLARSFLPLLPASITTVLAVTLNGYYGSHQVLSYAEPYLTARIYAEIFSLFALGFFLRKSYILGGLFYLLAIANHPLITLPALFMGLGLILQVRVWLLLSLACLLSGIGMGELGIKPFTGLVQTMDASWLNYNIERSPFVFLQEWQWRGVSQLLMTVSIAWYGYKFIENKIIKKLSLILFLSPLIFFTISYFGVSLFKSPLITSLQLPRILWLSLITNIFLLVILIWENVDKKNYTLLFSLTLLSCLFVSEDLKGIYIFSFVVVHLLIKYLFPEIEPSKPIILSSILISILPLSFHIFNLIIDLNEYDFISDKSLVTALLSDPIMALGAITITYYLINKKSLAPKIFYMTILLSYSILGLSHWYNSKMMDFQESAETYYDSPTRQLAIEGIRKIIPEASTVYWVNSPRKTWFWLQRANYVSFDQAAGTVFSRATTMEIMRRVEYVKNIGDIDSIKDWSTYLRYKKPSVPKKLKQADFDHLCSDTLINFVITEYYDEALKLVTFQDPIKQTKFGVYDCHNPIENKK